MRSIKQVNIKTRQNYFFNDMTNIGVEFVKHRPNSI